MIEQPTSIAYRHYLKPKVLPETEPPSLCTVTLGEKSNQKLANGSGDQWLDCS